MSEKKGGATVKPQPREWTGSRGGSRIGPPTENGISLGNVARRKIPSRPLPELPVISQTVLSASTAQLDGDAADETKMSSTEQDPFDRHGRPGEEGQLNGNNDTKCTAPERLGLHLPPRRRGLHLVDRGHRAGTIGDGGGMSLDRAVRRTNLRELEIQSAAEGTMKEVSFRTRSPPSVRFPTFLLSTQGEESR